MAVDKTMLDAFLGGYKFYIDDMKNKNITGEYYDEVERLFKRIEELNVRGCSFDRVKSVSDADELLRFRTLFVRHCNRFYFFHVLLLYKVLYLLLLKSFLYLLRLFVFLP